MYKKQVVPVTKRSRMGCFRK